MLRTLANGVERFAPNNHPGSPKIVVSAPTGMAADAVGGLTNHATYAFPYNQDTNVARRARDGQEPFERLHPEKLARMQNQFIDVYAQAIDEISMVAQTQLLGIDQRCREATGKENALFGGLSTYVFGDFR